MEITVTPELEEWISRKVASGSYSSPSEVCEAGIHLLAELEEEREESFAAFNEELHQRLEGLDRGEYVDPVAVRERNRQKSDQRKSVLA